MPNISNNKTNQNSEKRMIRALIILVQNKKLRQISVSELCALAKVNRTTFYNHYDNIQDIAHAARQAIMDEYAKLFADNTDGFTPENLLKMFRHLADNQILYNTYFRLKPNYQELLSFYDENLAQKFYPGQNKILIRYHSEFFAAGLEAIIRRWLKNGCRETPEEMTRIIISEYSHRGI